MGHVELVLLALGLGIAGVDVVGALVVLAALSRGIRRGAIAAFAVTALAGTTILGVAVALFVGDGIGGLVTRVVDLPDAVWVVLESVLVVLLLRWAYRRWARRREAPDPERRARVDRWLGEGPRRGGAARRRRRPDGSLVPGARGRRRAAGMCCPWCWRTSCGSS